MSPQLSANSTWFNFTCQSGNFSVYAFEGREEVSKPYEFSIELISRSAAEDLTGLLGTPACLSIADRSGESRLVHGIVREMEQLHTTGSHTHYRAVLVPRLWFLSQITDHRIFQNISVPEIIQQILKEQGFTDDSVWFRLFFDYKPREFCLQYNETTMGFIARLLEEEGIYYFFEHGNDSHVLCFCDREGGPQIDGESDIRFYPGSGQPADTAVISRLNLRHKVNSNAVMFKEWNFERPRLDIALTASRDERKWENAPVPPGMRLEKYQYPHLYNLPDPGKRYANLEMMRQLVFRQWIECESDVSRYLPSFSFTIHDHPRDDVNVQWWVISAEHEGKQPGVLEEEAPAGRGLEYKSKVKAIPYDTRFIPELEHPKPRIAGTQTAIVTGPEGEEIFTDMHGRVRVHFHWDRLGPNDEGSSCWVRVSQGWAGGQYGMVALPRIGHEVIVSFLEGDPDRPLITGRVYHGLNMPPYELPAHKTRTVFRSLSSPKGERYNELQIEDKMGEERIFVHAARDMETDVAANYREVVGGARQETTKKESREHFIEDAHITVEGVRRSLVKGADHVTIQDSRHTDIAQSELLETGKEIHLKAGQKVTLEAGVELTLKAGSNFFKIDPSGICMNGPAIRFSGGSAGSGSGQSAEPPLLPGGIAFAGNPKVTVPLTQEAALRRAAVDGKPFCARCEGGA